MFMTSVHDFGPKAKSPVPGTKIIPAHPAAFFLYPHLYMKQDSSLAVPHSWLPSPFHTPHYSPPPRRCWLADMLHCRSDRMRSAIYEGEEDSKVPGGSPSPHLWGLSSFSAAVTGVIWILFQVDARACYGQIELRPSPAFPKNWDELSYVSKTKNSGFPDPMWRVHLQWQTNNEEPGIGREWNTCGSWVKLSRKSIAAELYLGSTWLQPYALCPWESYHTLNFMIWKWEQ